MNCRDVEALLQEQLDGNQPDWSAAAPHLAECVHCRDLHQAARALAVGLQVLPAVEIPSGLTQSIVAGIRSDRRRRLLRGYALVAAAAAALLFAIPVLNALLSPGEGAAPVVPDQQANVVPVVPKQPEKPSPAPSLKSSVDEARLAVFSLADKTTKQAQQLITAATTPELPPMTPSGGITELDGTFEPARRSLQQVSADVGGGLQAVTSSAQQAVNYFSREIPTFKNKSKTP